MAVRIRSTRSVNDSIQAHAGSTRSERNSSRSSQRIPLNFLEATRLVTEEELRANDITRYHVTGFYREQIRKSGYYDQLKHIVEPSLKEFESPGNWTPAVTTTT